MGFIRSLLIRLGLVKAVVFVLDAADTARFPEADAVLQELLKADLLKAATGLQCPAGARGSRRECSGCWTRPLTGPSAGDVLAGCHVLAHGCAQSGGPPTYLHGAVYPAALVLHHTDPLSHPSWTRSPCPPPPSPNADPLTATATATSGCHSRFPLLVGVGVDLPGCH
ncbi:hypothetical protein VOLCADRAFT_88427 [Volvox carteri f. nagariensis]|uniref:Uncharacterized protein n=1 Tax=Volvox carteri f. nagariensis TaxID=3068 RepID=D8TNY9_VOLCA|nr:uncharacterized protein VOLCADRAFT_88427 [Volvox carteri f. nagariensis]EFJ50667.1 hypothetical protein VOLCADRAFT_88427 [Volvox carteri f. nagariensis]|eukprot:XP_002948260.1 hypothetical protein VOLCADRAFT_88427 [Volvox carteri f. nagariensis]